MADSTRMTSPEILFLWGDDKQRRSLYKVLAATGAEVRYAATDQGTLEQIDNCRLVVLDYDAVRPMANEVMRRISAMPSPPPVLVVTASRDKSDLIELFSHNVLTNLVAKNEDFGADELIAPVRKIIHNDIFGLDKYLTWGVQTFKYVLNGSEDRHQPLKDVRDCLDRLGANRRLSGLAQTVADELITNAVYNAPADEQGRPKYASRSRTEPVNLLPDEAVEVSFATDGKLFGICVADPFGRLESHTVRQYLRKCFMQGENQIDSKQGGAGLGLYYIFQSLNHFIINVAPGARTELIGLLDISGTFRDFALQAKSLHLFLHRNGK